MRQGLWGIVSGRVVKPSIMDAKAPTSTELENIAAWEDKAEKAAGELYLLVSQEQKVHFAGIASNPCLMWQKLEAVHLQKRPGARFNAYEVLFDIRKSPDESLTSLMTRVDTAMEQIQNLRPDAFTLDDMDKELVCMTLIRALPEEYSSFASSLQLLDKFEKEKLQEAFVAEELLRKRGDSASAAAALAVRTQGPSGSLSCEFCSLPGHSQSTCHRYKSMQAQASQAAQQKAQERGKNRSKGAKGSQNAAAAQDSSVAASMATEFAGKASLRSNPTPSSPQLVTDTLWTADTGATSHMTPHRHWLRDYTPHRVPVRLANNQIVYSAGLGSMLFVPEVEGKGTGRPVLFSRVLHVPELGSNLLSVLYLVRHHQFHVHISSHSMDFERDGTTLFTAPIDASNTAFLAGEVVSALESAQLSASSTLPLNESLWHRRFAHFHHAGVRSIVQGSLVDGCKLDSHTPSDPICEPCLSGKLNAAPFPSSSSRASRPLELVHSDVHGPLPVRTPSGMRYWVTFIDDYTRYRFVVVMRTKDETFSAFKRFKAWAETRLGQKVACLRDDKGGEYMSKAFQEFCDEQGIARQHTVRNRPQQNGVAERFNRTSEEGITAMLQEAKLPSTYWGEALCTLVYVLNRTPSSARPGTTPYEAWFGVKPNVSNLRIFGSLAYVHVQKDKRGPLGSHMEKCIFLGYPEGYKGWRFYNPSTKRVIISERAVFDERYLPGLKDWNSTLASLSLPPSTPHSTPTSSSESSDPQSIDIPPLVVPEAPAPRLEGEIAPQPAPVDNQDEPAVLQEMPEAEQPPIAPRRAPESPPRTPSPPPGPVRPLSPPPAPARPRATRGRSMVPKPVQEPTRRSTRPHNPPGEWWKAPQYKPHSSPAPGPSNRQENAPEPAVERPHAPAAASVPHREDSFTDDSEQDEFALAEASRRVHSGQSMPDPRNLKEALRRPDADKWQAAADEEIQAHIANGTWEPCKLPSGRTAIGCKWVLLQKFNPDGSIERYKGRLVAKGFSQRPGFDYTETFAPTVRMATIRTVLALSALEDLHLRSIDISHAFINGTLEEEIYMEQPEGYHFGNPGDVLRLKKSLYGLKQAGRVWNQKLHEELEKMDFKRVKSDSSLYVYRKGPTRIIIPIYIDDITISSTSEQESDKVVTQLSKRFELRDLGPTTGLLGIQIIRDRPNRTISLSQRQYIVDMLERFGFSGCTPVHTPMQPGLRLSEEMCPSDAQERAEMGKLPYINAVGALMYLATCTRPDIAFTVSQLARFNSNPGKQHWAAVKHLFRYLKATMDLKLVYAPDPSSKELFTVFSDADHGGNKDSGRSTGAYVTRIGTGAVNWSSKLQPIVTLSSTEAEYVAAVEAGKEICWMRNLLTELGYSVMDKPSTMHVDNNSAISVAKNPEHFGRLKHLDLRMYWLRDVCSAGMISPVFCPTAEMPADLLTKALERLKVAKLRSMLGLQD